MTGGRFNPEVLREVAHLAGGYTLVDHVGGWIEGKTLIEEPGQTLTIYTQGGEVYPGVIFRLKDDATRRGEDSLLVAREPVVGRFV